MIILVAPSFMGAKKRGRRSVSQVKDPRIIRPPWPPKQPFLLRRQPQARSAHLFFVKERLMALVTKLPNVDRIRGIELSRSESPQESKVSLQYSDQNNEWYETEMSLLDALYLLNLLEAMSREQGYDDLRRPPPGSALDGRYVF